MKMYIVSGSSGDYDDYTVWTVKAFFNEDNAAAFANLALMRANQIRKTGSCAANQYDPDMRLQDRIDYFYEAVDVGDSPTKAGELGDFTLQTMNELLISRQDYVEDRVSDVIASLEAALSLVKELRS